MRAVFFLAVAVLFARPAEGQPRGLIDSWITQWDKSTIELSELSVNVPRDAIPALDQPAFVDQKEASDWLAPREPVVVLTVGKEARAYPLQILIWHEIVNDKFGDLPVAVTFCPLCYSAVAFDRRMNGEVLSFGVSGMLRLSDLVMFDRASQSLWQQLSGEAIVGDYAGEVLRKLPAQILSFAQFRRSYPDALVLGRDTGHSRRYGANPYEGYDDINERPWMYSGPVDDRLRPMEKVVAVQVGQASRAFPHSLTRREGVIHDELGGVRIMVLHDPDGAASALDAARIADSRDLGQTGVFLPEVDGQELTFEVGDQGFRDRETGSLWSVTGRAKSGPLEGHQLEPVVHGDFFAFAWLAAFPDSDVYHMD